MVHTLLLAGIFSLVAIEAGDPRLKQERTYISPKAIKALDRPSGAQVLCHDRERKVSVCLTREEWQDALALNLKNARGRPYAVMIRYDTAPMGSTSHPAMPPIRQYMSQFASADFAGGSLTP